MQNIQNLNYNFLLTTGQTSMTVLSYLGNKERLHRISLNKNSAS